ncbi:MAG: phage/plasmid replication protein, II/X family, partial [Patescibacteria group bacterium]
VKQTTPKMTFYRNLSLITEVIPRAYLQNLQAQAASNVVPLIRMINVDFTKQHPQNCKSQNHYTSNLEKAYAQ